MKHLRYLLMAALVALPLAACDEDEEKAPVVEPTPVGTITGTVTVAGAGQANVDVTLVGKTSQSVKTGSDGKYTFANVEAGSYGVTISNLPLGSTFPTTSKTTAITQNGQTVTVDFAGSWIQTSSIVGTVTVAGQGINGVSVTLSGTQTGSSVTANGGNFSFTGLRAGSYTVAISNIPAGYTFAVTSYPVTVGVGEAKTVAFVGQPVAPPADPVTASVTIQAVTQGGTQFPVNPNNVQGQIDVVLNVNRGQNRVNRIELLLDNTVVASQTLTNPPEGEALPQSEQIVFSINTAEFSVPSGATTATVRFPNKAYTLAARLGLVNAQATSVTTSMQLTFNNADRFEVRVSATGNTASDALGRIWRSGNLTATVIPVMYSGRTVNSVTLSLRDDAAGFPTATGVVGPTVTLTSAPFVQTWVNATTGTNRVNTTENAGIIAVVDASVLSDGSPGPVSNLGAAGTHAAQPFFIRLDNVAPTVGLAAFQLAAANAPSGWVNGLYSFNTGVTGALIADGGVGGVTRSFEWALAPTGTTWTALPGGAAATADPLAESLLSTHYRGRLRVTDALGNTATKLLTTPLDAERFFGVDKTPPTALSFAATSVAADAIFNNSNFATAGNFQTSFPTDAASGFANPANPVMARVDRNFPGLTAAARCVVGTFGGGVCSPIATPGVTAVPTGSSGIYTYFAYAEDQALNRTATVDRRVLVDRGNPTIAGGITHPPTIAGGSSPSFSGPTVTDDMYVGRSIFYIGYSGINIPGVGTPVRIASGAIDHGSVAFGPFNLTASPAGSVDFFIRGIQQTDPLGPPFTPAPPMVAATDVNLTHIDLAGNRAAADQTQIFAAGVVGTPVPYAVGTGPNQIPGLPYLGFRLIATATTVCNQTANTLGCTAGMARSTTLQAVVDGPGGTYPPPFDRVRLYRVVVDGANPNYLVYLGEGTLSVTDTGLGGVRTYTWSLTVNPASPLLDGSTVGVTHRFVAIGLRNTGDGLMTQDRPITVHGLAAPPAYW